MNLFVRRTIDDFLPSRPVRPGSGFEFLLVDTANDQMIKLILRPWQDRLGIDLTRPDCNPGAQFLISAGQRPVFCI